MLKRIVKDKDGKVLEDVEVVFEDESQDSKQKERKDPKNSKKPKNTLK